MRERIEGGRQTRRKGTKGEENGTVLERERERVRPRGKRYIRDGRSSVESFDFEERKGRINGNWADLDGWTNTDVDRY